MWRVQRVPASVAVVSTTSKSWVIVAVLAIIADAEQYFSTGGATARSAFSAASPRPFHHEVHVNAGKHTSDPVARARLQARQRRPAIASRPFSRIWTASCARTVPPSPISTNSHGTWSVQTASLRPESRSRRRSCARLPNSPMNVRSSTRLIRAFIERRPSAIGLHPGASLTSIDPPSARLAENCASSIVYKPGRPLRTSRT